MLKHCKNVFKEHNDKKEGCAHVTLWPKDAPPARAARSDQNDWQWTRDFQLGGKFPFPSRDDFEKYNQANPDSPLRLSFDDMKDMLAKIKEWDEEKNAKKMRLKRGGGWRRRRLSAPRGSERGEGGSPPARDGAQPQRAPLPRVGAQPPTSPADEEMRAQPAPLARAAGGKGDVPELRARNVCFFYPKEIFLLCLI